MKKFVKVMLIVTLVLAIGGIGFSTAGIALGATTESVELFQEIRQELADNLHWFKTEEHEVMQLDYDDDDYDDDYDDYDDGEWHGDENVITQLSEEDDCRVYDLKDVSGLEISLHYDELVFEAAAVEGIRVEVYNDPEQNVRVEADDDGIEIESRKKKEDRVVKVYYPEDKVFDKLDVEVGAGVVTAADPLEVRELDISVGAGSISIDELRADNIEGECGVGEIVMTLAGPEENWNYKLECGAGEIGIGDESFTALAGEKKLQNPGASGQVELECGMGEIQVDFME